MASDILSQNDIDALLNSGSKTDTSTMEVAGRPNPALYDFRRPHRVSKERLRTLEAMHERLVKSLEGWTMGRVRGQVEYTLQGIEQLTFGEFSLSLATPCASYLLEIRDSGGQQAVIDFGTDFAFFLVDRLLGGRGVGDSPQRALTAIERMVVRTVAERITTGVREIWGDYVNLGMSITGFESVPEILRATSSDAPVLVASIAVVAGEKESIVSICLPFGVVDTFFADVAVHRRANVTGSDEEQRVNRQVVESSLRVTSLPISTRLPEFRISMKSLSALKEGSVLATGISRNSDIEVKVGSQTRFSGRPARVGRQLAVRITEKLDGSDLLDELDAGTAPLRRNAGVEVQT